MPTVFRIEHPETKRGPYMNAWGRDDAVEQMVDRHNLECVVHPGPHNDNGIERHIENEEFCGFSGLWQLCKWFSGVEILMLDSFGYEITVIEDVTITATGEKQVLFVRETQNETV
ncbi:MAG TPA: hypothetical protein ENH82_13705 [bacterium]|nr:hypothetical protein [bacterium]